MAEPTPRTDRGIQFDRRAALLLAVLSAVGVIVVVLVNLASSDPPQIVRIVASLGAAILLIPYLATVRGLGAGRTWARGVAAILLGLIAVGGLVELVGGLGSSQITLPFAAIAAIAILAGARDVPMRIPPGYRRTAAGLVAIALVGTGWPLISGQLLNPGGSLLVVGEDALSLTVDVDCGATAADGSARAVVDVAWMWRSRDVMPGGTDGVLVDWSATNDGLILESSGSLPDGIWEGGGSRSAGLLQPYTDGTSWTYGIEIGRVGQIDASFSLTLQPVRPGQEIAVTVLARYAHLDRWSTVSAAPSCTVPAS